MSSNLSSLPLAPSLALSLGAESFLELPRDAENKPSEMRLKIQQKLPVALALTLAILDLP
jgi:hypothetical protein